MDSISRFFDRVERLVKKCYGMNFAKAPRGKAEKELDYVRNNTIKCVSADIESFSFNTALARVMEYVNAIYAYDGTMTERNAFFADCVKDLVLLLAPFAPHFAEELWEMLGQPYSVFNQRYPVADEKALVRDEVELAVQINSKLRARITVPTDAAREQIEAAALEAVSAQLNGAKPKKIIIVPGRLVNIIA